MTRPSSSLRNIPANKPLVVDTKGLIVPLGEAIGVGGEGCVYEVLKQPGVVAKIYHKAPLEADQTTKLKTLLKVNAKGLAPIAAWPQDLLLEARRQRPCGILLPRISNARELHELYGATPRAKHFPNAHWHHLILAARNTAAAFAAMHARGVVVGDVNQGNLLVDEEMCVRFIDCDSFQITAGDRVFPCPVGTPHFTPPELQSVRLADAQRTPQHDVFGMAILIFHLLFVGRHPFAGRYRGDEEMHIERAISELRFAFSADRDATRMDPPPASLSLDDLSPQVASLFEAAFRAPPRSNTQRPDAQTWVKALEEMLKQRKQCRIDPTHVYFNQASECPWCRIETGGGPSFFINSELTGGSLQSRIEAYDRCMKQVGEIHFPDLARKSLKAPALPPVKEHQAPPAKSQADWLAMAWVLFAVLSLGGAFFAPLLAVGAVGTVATAAGLWWGRYGKVRRTGNANYLSHLDNHRQGIEQQAAGVWQRHTAREAEFDTFSAVVDTGRERYWAEAEDMESLLRQLRLEQKDDFLRSLEIRQYRRRIPGLQRGDIAVLLSYGVETAMDCEPHLLAGIPQLPPEVVVELMNWRERCAEHFAFRPEAGITEKEVEIDRQEAAARFKISQARKVLNGATRLRAMAQAGKTALQQDLTKLEKRQSAMRTLAREYQDFQASRTPVERMLNQNVGILAAAALAPPLIGLVLWGLL